MNGLQTPRVMVVDDDPSEALSLMRAFGRAGVASIFFSGRVDELPRDHQLRGIRLAALDMDLANAYSPGDPIRIIGPTLTVLERVISGDNGPYLAIAWTAHPDVVDTFREQLPELPCPPVGVVALPKLEVKNGEDFDFDAILEHLRRAVTDAYPLAVFALWEQLVHDAAADTVSLAPLKITDWQKNSRDFLIAMIKATRPIGLTDSTSALRFLFEGLNPVHFDHLEASTAALNADDAAIVDPLVKDAQGAVVDDALKAKLNRALLIGQPATPEPMPGNIYILEETGVMKSDDLRTDMVQANQLNSKTVAKFKPLAIEITPICDYQNRKMKIARLMAGLAFLPGQEGLLNKHAEFIRFVHAPIEFTHEHLNGVYSLAWTAHYILSIPVEDLAIQKPIGRLREVALLDLQAWASSHAARPGYLSIR